MLNNKLTVVTLSLFLVEVNVRETQLAALTQPLDSDVKVSTLLLCLFINVLVKVQALAASKSIDVEIED